MLGRSVVLMKVDTHAGKMSKQLLFKYGADVNHVDRV